MRLIPCWRPRWNPVNARIKPLILHGLPWRSSRMQWNRPDQADHPVDEITRAAVQGVVITDEIISTADRAAGLSSPPSMNHCQSVWRCTTTYLAVPARPWPVPSARLPAHPPVFKTLPALPTGPRNSQRMLTQDRNGYRTKQNGQPHSRHNAGCGCP